MTAPTGKTGHAKREDAACRYCGILPDQDLPRPSYHEMRVERDRAIYERDDARRNEERANGRLMQMRQALKDNGIEHVGYFGPDGFDGHGWLAGQPAYVLTDRAVTESEPAANGSTHAP